MRCLRSTLVLLGSLAMTGCGDDGANGNGGGTCEPLAAETEPFEVGEVVGVGRASDGKLYAVDRVAGSDELRVLESEGDFLFLRSVAGGASMGSGGDGEWHLLSVESEAMGYSLIVEIDEGEVRMARTTRDDERMLRVADAEPDEVLEVVDPEVLDELAPRALPTDVVIEYLARTPDGELLLVVHPDSDEAVYEDFRLFFGDEGELVEHELMSVTRARDGGSTHLIFELDGELADAFFPVMLGSDEPPQATLETGGETVPLERLPDEAAAGLTSATFSCL